MSTKIFLKDCQPGDSIKLSYFKDTTDFCKIVEIKKVHRAILYRFEDSRRFHRGSRMAEVILESSQRPLPGQGFKKL